MIKQEAVLTKREQIAAMALQGILANKVYEPPRRNKLKGMASDGLPGYAAGGNGERE